MTLELMLGFVSGVLHPAQGCKILVFNEQWAELQGKFLTVWFKFVLPYVM